MSKKVLACAGWNPNDRIRSAVSRGSPQSSLSHPRPCRSRPPRPPPRSAPRHRAGRAGGVGAGVGGGAGPGGTPAARSAGRSAPPGSGARPRSAAPRTARSARSPAAWRLAPTRPRPLDPPRPRTPPRATGGRDPSASAATPPLSAPAQRPLGSTLQRQQRHQPRHSIDTDPVSETLTQACGCRTFLEGTLRWGELEPGSRAAALLLGSLLLSPQRVRAADGQTSGAPGRTVAAAV
jgi:hypothetical protein